MLQLPFTKTNSTSLVEKFLPYITMVEETTDVAVKAEDPKAIEGLKERLEFFFSDANIRQDVFIRKLLMNSDEKSVGVDVLLRFNTIKKFSDESSVLIQAAKELKDSLVVDEEKMTITRVTPFTIDMMNQNIPKSLLVKNLPINESKQYDVKVDELRELFENYGKVALVKLKFSSPPFSGKEDYYGPSKKRRNFPSGSANIEFHTQEDLEKAAEATLTTKGGETVEPKDKIELGATETRKSATELGVMLLSEFVASCKDKKEKRGDKKRSKPHPEADEIPKFTFDWKPKCVIKVKGLPEGCDREAMLSAIGKGLDVSAEEVMDRKIYVDYSRGQKDGAIRFPEPSDSVEELAKKLKAGDLKILDAAVEDAAILEGDEEKKYWEDFIEFKNKQAIQRAEEKKNRGGKNKRHKFGR
uniref:HTH La-type RNA-binding domain-containing protein n=1 Tax=Pseudo-nitzschia delicatissima TaxID=44447 RepID=A0A7S0Y790_9STRA